MGGSAFKYFVVLADMRTGSNFLASNINQFEDLECHGELFNQQFIGGPDKDEMFGISLAERRKDPLRLLSAMQAANGKVIPGFRFFHNHTPKILARCLADTTCGKVILTRNPIDSYVSRKIAAVTKQWILTNLKNQKTAKIDFDAQEFEGYLEKKQQFQLKLLNTLQSSGQTAFYINYDDIQSLDVLNGLAAFLGSSHRIEALNKDLKKQNPSSIESKVNNFAEMQTALGEMDLMGLSRTPNFEPRRGAGVPNYIASKTAPLLFVPIKCGPLQPVLNWLGAHDGSDPKDLLNGLNQKTLRQWWHDHPGFQSFTVLRHPVARAYQSFCDYVLSDDAGGYRDARAKIINIYKVPIPKKGAAAPGYDLAAHKRAFLAFLGFLKVNLTAQTNVRVDMAWASQNAIIQGASTVAPIRHIIHEADMIASMAHIETLAGLPKKELMDVSNGEPPFALADIYDQEVEDAAREAYARDYLNFGFSDWKPLN